MTSGQSAVATCGPRGASHARTAGGTASGKSAGAACPSSGGRSSGALAGPQSGAGARSAAAPDAGDVPASAPAPASATEPAGQGGFRHVRLLGSHGVACPAAPTDARRRPDGARSGPALPARQAPLPPPGQWPPWKGTPRARGAEPRRGRRGASLGTALSHPKAMQYY